MKPHRWRPNFLIAGMLMSCMLFAACRRHATHVVRAFYYWKSNSAYLDGTEKTCLNKLQVATLYVKLFEVEYKPPLGAIPAVKSILQNDYYDSVLRHIHLIPVVFIKNDVFVHMTNAGLDTLAGNLVFLADKYYRHIVVGDSPYEPGSIGFKELQIDCDWTASTRVKYFYLLKAIKRRSASILSCTLRLYPYKYRDKMGVPPVDKAMLMCYNLVSPFGNQDKNSILDTTELGAYLKPDIHYPLHLDVALPLYSWMQLYQNHRFAGMLYHRNNSLLPGLKHLKPLWYEVTKDTVVDGLYLRTGDEVKYEQTTAASIGRSIRLLKDHMRFDDTTTVTFFHLDEDQLTQYSNETLDSLYRAFEQ